MITIKIAGQNFIFSFPFGPTFDRDKTFVNGVWNQNGKGKTGGFKGIKWNPTKKQWIAPILADNIQKIKENVGYFSNPEIVETIKSDNKALYCQVLSMGDSFALYSIAYDGFIVSLIKSNQKKGDHWDPNSKCWNLTPDTWDFIKIDLAQYLDKKNVNFMFPIGEDIDKLIKMSKPKTDKLKYMNRTNQSEVQQEKLLKEITLKFPYLRPYQAINQRSYYNNQYILDAEEMGLGKTVNVITYLKWEQPKKVLIVVPASLKKQWEDEIQKFAPELMKYVMRIHGTPKQRIKQWKVLNRTQYIIITNYANLRTKDYETYSLRSKVFDMLVIDEATKVKNYQSETFARVKELRARKIVGLTGTPIENHLTDLYSIMSIVRPGYWKWTVFRDQFLQPKSDYGGWIAQPGAGPKVAQQLKEFRGFIRWKKRDLLDELPNRLHNYYTIKLKSRELTEYKKIVEGVKILRSKSGKEIKQGNTLALLSALRRLCSDPGIYFPERYDSSKKEEFVRIVKDIINGEKMVCFSSWKDVVYSYANALLKEGIKSYVITGDVSQKDRDLILAEFKKSEDIKVLLCTDALAYGVNLQFCSFLINIDLHWNPAVMGQRMGRIDRIGQKASTINIISFVCEDTIEEYVQKTVLMREDFFDQVISPNEMTKNDILWGYLESLTENEPADKK